MGVVNKAVVYQAIATSLDRLIAGKVLSPA
jgi:hypothetical protein